MCSAVKIIIKKGITHKNNIYPDTVPILNSPSSGKTNTFNCAERIQSGKI
jgi:hypothetical protein